MGKITFQTSNQNQIIGSLNIAGANDAIDLVHNPNTNNNFTITDDKIDIEVENNNNITIQKNNAPLNSINIMNNSTLMIHNDYAGEVKTTVIINNSTLTQTGKDLPIKEVALYSNAKFNFTHNDSSYSLHNNNLNYSTQPANAGITVNVIEIKNIHAIVDTAINLTKNSNISIETLKSYKKNEEILDIFAKQNNLSYSYIHKNYFKFTGIAKSLEGSDLDHLPTEVILKISSYLNLSDISYQPILYSTNDATGEIILDIDKIKIEIIGQVENYSE